jgi:hypothetical protein
LPSVCCFAGWPESSSSRYITGTIDLAIGMPFLSPFVFISLQLSVTTNRFDSGKPDPAELLNSVDQQPTTSQNPARHCGEVATGEFIDDHLACPLRVALSVGSVGSSGYFDLRR